MTTREYLVIFAPAGVIGVAGWIFWHRIERLLDRKQRDHA